MPGLCEQAFDLMAVLPARGIDARTPHRELLTAVVGQSRSNSTWAIARSCECVSVRSEWVAPMAANRAAAPP